MDIQIQHPRGPRESHLVAWAGLSAAGPQSGMIHWGLAPQSLGSSSPHIPLDLGWDGPQYLEGLGSALSCCIPGPRDTAVRGLLEPPEQGAWALRLLYLPRPHRRAPLWAEVPAGGSSSHTQAAAQEFIFKYKPGHLF